MTPVTTATAAPFVELRHLGQQFGVPPRPPMIADLSLSVKRGEFVSLIGASGCGKFTVLRLLAFGLPVCTGALLVAFWYALRLHVLPVEQRFLLPAPEALLRAFADHGAQLGAATLSTARGVLLGFAAPVVGSVLLALTLSISPKVRAGLYPWLMALQLTPIIVLARILILWAGPGLPSAVIITFLISFFPLVVNTKQGFLAVIYSAQFQLPALFATALVSCLLEFVFTGAVVGLSWLALHRWHEAYQTYDA